MRTTKQRRRLSFYGEEVAGFLVEWLNGPGDQNYRIWVKDLRRRHGVGLDPTLARDKQARRRIEGLLSDLTEVSRLAALLRWDRSPAEDRPGWKKFEQAAEAANHRLRRYRSHPLILCNQPACSRNVWKALPLGGTQERSLLFYWGTMPNPPFVSPQELRAVWALGELVRRGLLHQLRRCLECDRWLFARKPGQRHCQAKCRKQHYHASAKYQEKRRANYMRKKFLSYKKTSGKRRRRP